MAKRGKTTTAKGPKASAKPVNLDDDEMRALAHNHKPKFVAALNRKKSVDADFRNCCKSIKAELGDEGVAIIKAMIELDTPEGEAKVKSRIRAEALAAKWMGLPMGAQIELELGTPDRTPAVDRAYDEGKQDSMAGKPRGTAYDPSTPQYTKYLEGYASDQEARARKLSGKADDNVRDLRPRNLQELDRQRQADKAPADVH